MEKVIRNSLLVFFIVLLAFSAWRLWGILDEYRQGTDSYDALEQYVSFESPNDSQQDATVAAVPSEAESTTAPEAPDVSAWPQVNFSQLFQINPDFVGWIYIEGTKIHYPVVQGTDNSFYLNHLFDGTKNKAGCIFLDYRCAADFSGRHSIIYGHHLKNKSMFTDLMKYKSQKFYDEHPVVLLATPTAYYRIQLFSGYVSDVSSEAWELDIEESEYSSWLKDIQSRSCFESDYTPTTQDKIVTLSTCTYEFDSAKFVLHGYISEVIENTKSK